MARIIRFPGQSPHDTSQGEPVENLERIQALQVNAIESVMALLDQVQKTASLVRSFRADQAEQSARDTKRLPGHAKAAGMPVDGGDP